MILRAGSVVGQENAHLEAEQSSLFSRSLPWAKLGSRVGRRSHLCRVPAHNYRYPSPSRWSGPIFRIRPVFSATDRRGVADHICGRQVGFAFVNQAFHNRMDAGQKKGSETWTTGKSRWRWLAPLYWQDASLTIQNAPLQVPLQALSLPTSRIPARLWARLSVEPQAPIATTRAFAAKISRGAGLTRARPLTANRAPRVARLTPDIPNLPHRGGVFASRPRGLACR